MEGEERPGSLSDPLYFVLPPSDPLFAGFLRERAASPDASTWGGLLPSTLVCALLLVMRAGFNALFAAYVRAGAPGLPVLQRASSSGGGAAAPSYDSGVLRPSAAAAAPSSSSSSGSGGSGGGGKPSSEQARRSGGSSGGGSALGGGKALPSLANKIEEEVWVSTGSVLLLVAGWRVLASLPPQRACGVLDNAGCLRGWPVIPVAPNVLAYYNAELGWYAHLMLKHALGLGLDDGSAMHYHHVATVALVVTSYLLGVQNMGMLVFCLLNVSSPFLHASKLGNMLEMKRARVWLFIAFAAAYFVARLVLFPYVVVKVAVLGALRDVPSLTRHFLGYWLMFNALLLALCALQGLWFVAIVRILRTAFSGGGGEAQDRGVAAVVEARDAARGLRDKRRQQAPGVGVGTSGGGGGGAGGGASAAERGTAGLLAPAGAATVELASSAAGGGGGGFAAGGGGGSDDGRKGGRAGDGRAGEAACAGGGGGSDQTDADAAGFAGAAKHIIGRLVRFSSGGGGRGVVGTGPSTAERAAAAAAAAERSRYGNGHHGHGNGHGNNGKAGASAFERQPLLLATGPSVDLESQRSRRSGRAARDAAADAGAGGGSDTANGAAGAASGGGGGGGGGALAAAPSVGGGTGRATSLSGGAAGRRSAAAAMAAAGAAAEGLAPQPSATTQVYVR